MVEPLQLQTAAWAATSTLELGLFVQLLRRKLGRVYPLFFAYLVSTILQSIAVAALYRGGHYDKLTTWKIAWLTQGVVVFLRASVLLELNRKVLSCYIGIWALARRILLGVGAVVLACDLLLSKGQWQWMIMNGVRGLELAMAAVIVTMLMFARYYRLPVSPLQRSLAVGLCLYSVFYVVNYSLLERVLQEYAVLWNFLGIFAFIASLLLWISAVTRYAESEVTAPPPEISPELHGKLTTEVNTRLYLLNRQLIQFFHIKDRGS
ncbi:MAG TPA: hypothetical protein VFI38_10600 [Candidatus Acidoferrum sp.]|nr:hypothetical protein [Candidatus Acidoferrum sp.]